MTSKEWREEWIKDLKKIIEINTELERLTSSSPRPITLVTGLTDIMGKFISLLKRSRERELKIAEELELIKENLEKLTEA